MTVSDRLLEFFCNKGIKHIFLIPGAQIDPLIDALAEIELITPIVANHELSTGYMADGYARISSKPGVVFSIGSSGAINLVAAAVNARVEESPVMFITGSVATSHYGSGCFQDTSNVGSNDMAIFKEAVGHSLVCGHAQDIDKCINQIINYINKKKPLHVVFPLDIQQHEINKDKLILKSIDTSKNCESNNPKQIDLDIKLFKNKERPTPYKYDIISLETIMTTLQNIFLYNIVYCLDAGQVRYAGNAYIKNKSNICVLQSSKQAPMGWAICASMGVKLAAPDQAVIAIFGDGSMRMHGIELTTAVRYNIPIVFVLCDNKAYGTVYARHKHTKTEKLTHLDDLNWQTYVSSFGMKTFHIVDKSSLFSTLQQASKLKQPSFVWIHVPIEDDIMQEATIA